ncbi:MAG: gliding motility-associated C-terminal domain-containing protein, partial [Bacteroidota bacterium]
CIFVDEYLDPPVAIDDNDTTSIGTPVVIDIKANDITFGGIDTAFLLTEPLYGTATLNPDCSVTYNAGDEFCEREDVFSYVICNPNGCDTADVFVFIECIDIFIFNAVSANRDGSNDVFYIANIEDYPDSELFIYNRWGTLVYNTENYRNDWRGTYNNNRDLPDGTYYYVLKLNDNEGRTFNGYIELHR